MAQSWFIMRGESRLGPFTHHGLVSLAANGGLAPYDMVWCTELRAPIPASGVAGLFSTVDAGFEPDPEPDPEPEPPAPPRAPPAPVSTVPPPPPRRETMLPPPPPRALTEQASDDENEFSFGKRKRDRFATLLQEQDPGDVSVDEDESETVDDEDDDLEPTVPVVRRPVRRGGRPRKQGDSSGLLIALGGMALLAVIMLIVILEQGGGTPSPPPRPKKSPPSVTVSQPRPQPKPQPPVAPRPEPPPPPKPRYDKEPLIAETAKASVDAIFQAAPSVKPRFRSLWESQLTDLLTQQTKGMREEEEIRAKVKEVSESWTRETRRFVDEQSAPAPQSSDAIDRAAGEEPGADGGGTPDPAAAPAGGDDAAE